MAIEEVRVAVVVGNVRRVVARSVRVRRRGNRVAAASRLDIAVPALVRGEFRVRRRTIVVTFAARAAARGCIADFRFLIFD